MTTPQYAPAPYSTLDIGSRASFHAYIVDANGRKIGVAWGPVVEKVWTAALWAAAPDLLAALRAVVAVADRKTVEFDMARAALAKVEGCPMPHPNQTGGK